MRTCVGLSVACCIISLGLTGVAFALFIAEKRKQLFDNVNDLMFIDNTEQTFFQGPIGEATSEREQFQKWAQSSHDMYKECLREEGNTKEECTDGRPFLVTVFNVTNAFDVVMGEKVKVQEFGPLHFLERELKTSVDKAYWDQTGIAKFQSTKTYALDEQRCTLACRALLKAEIVVPNPVWNALVAAPGVELAFAIALVHVGIIKATPQDQLPFVGVDLFNLIAGAENDAFVSTFLTEPDMMRRLAAIGAFLATTKGALSAMMAGDLSKTCLLGAHAMPVSRCVALLKATQQAVPKAWRLATTATRPSYGAGLANPVFIRVTVEQLLGFDGSSFMDPLTRMSGVNFAALTPYIEQSELLMASKFGERGTSYYAKFNNAIVDCRFDRDCTLEDASRIDSCEPSSACTPHSLGGYKMQLPGRLWGEAGGFPGYPAGKVFQMLVKGLHVSMVSKGEFDMDIGQFALKYTRFLLSNIKRRTENCNGTGPGSKGFDCDSPYSAVYIGHMAGDKPLYLSVPYFNGDLMQNPGEVQVGQDSEPYSALSRVEITPCTGNSWCNDTDPLRDLLYMYVEPESGIPFAGQNPTQINLRIGRHASSYFPQMRDAIVPIYTKRSMVSAPQRTLQVLAKMQATPANSHQLFWVILLGGVILSAHGVCVLACFWHRRQKIVQADMPLGPEDMCVKCNNARPILRL